MFGIARISFLLSLTLACPLWPALEEHILVLFVTDTAEEPVNNIVLTCKGDCSQTGAVQGKVRLKLPPQTRPGEWVTLQIVKRPGDPDWVLISPWDGRIIVPSFENKADNALP